MAFCFSNEQPTDDASRKYIAHLKLINHVAKNWRCLNIGYSASLKKAFTDVRRRSALCGDKPWLCKAIYGHWTYWRYYCWYTLVHGGRVANISHVSHPTVTELSYIDTSKTDFFWLSDIWLKNGWISSTFLQLIQL